jgi:hypothetical protein
VSCTNDQALTTKYDPAGRRIWKAWLSAPGRFASGRAITTDSAGNVYVTFEFRPGQFLGQIVTAKYNANGVRQWISFYRKGQSLEGRPVAIAVDSAGNTYVTGFLGKEAVNFHPWTTIKYAPNGAQLWVAEMDIDPTDATFHDNSPTGLVVDGQGNAYVTGRSFDGGMQSKAVTVKYGPGGNQLWLDAFTPTSDAANRGIALGPDGNLHVVGSNETHPVDGSPPVSKAHIIKYSPSGSRVWVAQHQSSGASRTDASHIALDRQGNSYVLGAATFSTGSSSRTDYATRKFDRVGGLVWERFSPSPEGDISHLRSTAGIVLNSIGDSYVAVTGRNPQTGATTDITTIKYNTHGNEKWVINYDGPAFGEEVATGIAIRGGGVFVIGFSTGVNSNYDWAAIKYVQDGTSVSPASLTFAPQAVGTTSAPQALTVTNISEAALQITGIAASGNFGQTNNCPGSLAPGNNCTIQVTFTPTSAGAKAGAVTVSSHWAGSPQVVELSGAGQ